MNKLAEWHTAGFIERCSEKPRCVSPLSVNVKSDGVKEKIRVCLDASRHVNNYFVHATKIRLDNLPVAEQWFRKDMFFMFFDLVDQFHQVGLREDMKDFLGFKFVDENGKEQYYRFCKLQYGLKPAVTIVTNLLKLLVLFFSFSWNPVSLLIRRWISPTPMK